MNAPQSWEELAPYIEALKRLDPLLDIRWNPKAFMTQPGSYSALGKRVDPVYDGRYEVIRWQTPNLHRERGYAVICTVTEPYVLQSGGKTIPMMQDHGPFAPVGWWLVDFMALWDRAQGRLAEAYAEEVWAEHDRNEANEFIEQRAAHQEGAERIYRKFAGQYWMGGSQGKAHPETEKALWPSKVPSPL